MAIPRISKAENVKVSEMEAGSGWMSRRMLEDETDIDVIRSKVAALTELLSHTEVRNSRGFLCARPS